MSKEKQIKLPNQNIKVEPLIIKSNVPKIVEILKTSYHEFDSNSS